MQVAYEEEAEDMESLKTWTLSLCNKRTNSTSLLKIRFHQRSI